MSTSGVVTSEGSVENDAEKRQRLCDLQWRPQGRTEPRARDHVTCSLRLYRRRIAGHPAASAFTTRRFGESIVGAESIV